MSSFEQRRHRKADVRVRAGTPSPEPSLCKVIGCGKPARVGTSDGLDRMFCRAHADHYQRHGSPYKGSYPAKVLNPYRQAALVWLMENRDAGWVKDAALKVEGLFRRAGAKVEAFRLPGLDPRQRANACWARLRAAGVDPMLPIAAWLAVEMVAKDDKQAVSKNEYKRVQAAKLVHRMASGTHKRWEHEHPHPLHPGLPPIVEVEEKHWYPKSRGRVLRHIGEDLERACEFLTGRHLEDLKAFKKDRDKQGSFDWSPYPKGFVSRKRDSR